MAKKSLNILKSWFKTGLFPTQQQFWDTWDSFFHKDDMIPASQVENLQGLLDQKIDKKDLPDGDIAIDDVNGLRSELDDRENKVAGKGLSTQDYTTEEKNKLVGIADNANNYQHPATHPAAMIDESDDKQFVTKFEKLQFQDAYSAMMYLMENVTDDGDTLRKLYDLIQTIKGNVPIAGDSLEKIYNLITGITNADKEYADIASRDADKANLDNGESVIVTNAQADPTVVNGWAIYRYNESTQNFLKLAEQESIDVDLSQYMKFTDLATDFIDDASKPAAASTVKALKDIIDTPPPPQWYGIEWEGNPTIGPWDSSPICTRIGNMEYHKTLPIQNMLKRCVLWDNGGVRYYINPDDHSRVEGLSSYTANYAGSSGQVMVEVPDFYVRKEREGTKHRWMIAMSPITGFKHIKKFYMGAYEACIQRSTNKLCSVRNIDTDYRGGSNISSWDGTYRDLNGKPTTNKSRTEFREAAINRGIGWHQQMPYEYYGIAILFMVEYATLNTQTPFNSSLTPEGYKQGGLGGGATTATHSEWLSYNSMNPIIPIGITDDNQVNKTKVRQYTVNDFGGAGIPKTFDIATYRGIENIFGHIGKFCDGLTGIAHGAYVYLYATDDQHYINDTGEGGALIHSIDGYTSGYITEPIDHILPFPSRAGLGSPTTNLCDKAYFGDGSSWAPYSGGTLKDGTGAGFFSITGYGLTSGCSHIGTRLCFSKIN